MSRKRRTHSPDFKAKVALAAIKGDEILSELSQRFGINANLVVKWKKPKQDLATGLIFTTKNANIRR